MEISSARTAFFLTLKVIDLIASDDSLEASTRRACNQLLATITNLTLNIEHNMSISPECSALIKSVLIENGIEK